MLKRSILLSAMCGLLLSVLLIFLILLPRIEMIWWLVVGIGSVIVVFALLLKNKSFKQALMRTLFMFVFSIVSMRFFDVIGVFEWLAHLLNITISTADDPAAGLGAVFFLIVLLFESIIISIILLIRSIISRRKKDGSVS